MSAISTSRLYRSKRFKSVTNISNSAIGLGSVSSTYKKANSSSEKSDCWLSCKHQLEGQNLEACEQQIKSDDAEKSPMSAGLQNGPPYLPIHLTSAISLVSNPKRQLLSKLDILHAPPTISSTVPKISHLHTLPAVLPLPNFSILPAHTLKHSHKQIMSLLFSPFIQLPQ